MSTSWLGKFSNRRCLGLLTPPLLAVVLAGCGSTKTVTQTITAPARTITVAARTSPEKQAANQVIAAIPREFDPAGHPTAVGADCNQQGATLQCVFAYRFTLPNKHRRVMIGAVPAACTPVCKVNWGSLQTGYVPPQ